jgi:hypothetical protein
MTEEAVEAISNGAVHAVTRPSAHAPGVGTTKVGNNAAFHQRIDSLFGVELCQSLNDWMESDSRNTTRSMDLATLVSSSSSTIVA